MSDLISKVEVLSLLESMMETYWDRKQILSVVRSKIEKLPSAEPKGRWIWDENGMDWNIGAWTCSACGSKAETFWQTYKESNPHRYAGSHYCSNCGAKMEVEK